MRRRLFNSIDVITAFGTCASASRTCALPKLARHRAERAMGLPEANHVEEDGMSGTWYPNMREQLEAELRPLAPNGITLLEDEADWEAALGDLVRDEWDDLIATLRDRRADNDELPAWAS